MGLEALQIEIILPALCAGCAVLLSHVPLGREVLKRGIIFIDLALAQFAGMGIVIAYVLELNNAFFGTQAIALTSALLGAGLIASTEHWVERYQEAFIGSVFILAATASVLLLASNPHAGDKLRDILVGQVLWVDYQQLWLPFAVGLSYFVANLMLPKLFTGRLFYFLFAIAITISVQLVGLYLVFASLIIPALAARNMALHKALICALALGIFAYTLGLLGAAILDLPGGPTVVWTLAICTLVVTVVQKLTQTAD